MSDQLRVKNASSKKAEKGVAVKIKENTGEIPQSKKGANIAFKEMWADAFMRKRAGLEISESITVKQKAPAPYIYLRICLMYVIAMIVMFCLFYLFHGYEMYPLLIVLVSTFVPVVALVFFYEMDTSGRLTAQVILLLFFLVGIAAIAIKFISFRFIYDINNAISIPGALAIGLMEIAVIFALCFGFLTKMKIKDHMTGVLIGTIIGVGFALVNNFYSCFYEGFVSTEYTPTVDAIVYNETLMNSMTNIVMSSFNECLLHAGNYVFAGIVLSGIIISARNKGYKDKTVNFLLVILVLVGWVFASLWIIPPSVFELFVIISRLLMTFASVMATVKTVRTGLSKNTYV